MIMNSNDSNKDNLPPSDIPFKKIVIQAEDVPGALLKHSVEKHSVLQLKRFLQCRGIKTSNKIKKKELIAQVEKYYKKPIVGSIDGGAWSYQKEKLLRAADLNNNASHDLIFPTTTWKDFPSNEIPKLFSFGAIYHYLIDTCTAGDETLSGSGFDTAKPFNKGRMLFKSGFVTNMKDALTVKNQNYCVRSDVYVSMRCELHKVLVMLNRETGKILDASCDCKASTLARCSHIAALLFAVEDHLLTFGNSSVACTSKVCAWNQPRRNKDPTEIMNRQYTNKRNFQEVYNFKPDNCIRDSNVNSNNLLQLCEQYEAPTMWELLLEYRYEDYELSNERKLVIIENIKSFMEALKFGMKEPGPLPGTGQQANCNLWFARRKFLITASCCTNFRSVNKDNIFSKLNTHLYGSPFNSIYTKYGKDHEKDAIAHYIKETKNYVKLTRLWINPNYPGLGASPDGVVFDKNLGTWGLLEVKCPYVLKDVHPTEIDKLTPVQRTNFCATLDNGLLKLKKNHKYHSQVQMQMGVCNKGWCDFVLWSKKGISVERITFDRTCWNELANNCMSFHSDYICLEYFENRIPRKLQPIKMD